MSSAFPSTAGWRRVDCRLSDYRQGLVGTDSMSRVFCRDRMLVVISELFAMCVAQRDSESVRCRPARQLDKKVYGVRLMAEEHEALKRIAEW